MSTRITAIVRGKVQRAGFRDFVQEQAYVHDAVGTVRNLPDGTVEIVAEAPKPQLDQFLGAVRAAPFPIKVERIDPKAEEPSGRFTDFAVIREPNEAILDKLDTGARYIREMDQHLTKEIRGVGDEVRTVGDKVDGVGEEVRTVAAKVDRLTASHEGFAARTDQHFQILATRYDQISQTMQAIFKELQAERREHRETIERLIKLIVEGQKRTRGT